MKVVKSLLYLICHFVSICAFLLFLLFFLRIFCFYFVFVILFTSLLHLFYFFLAFLRGFLLLFIFYFLFFQNKKQSFIILAFIRTFLSPCLCLCAKFALQISVHCYFQYYRKFRELSQNRTKADINNICTYLDILQSAYLFVREICFANFCALLFLILQEVQRAFLEHKKSSIFCYFNYIYILIFLPFWISVCLIWNCIY